MRRVKISNQGRHMDLKGLRFGRLVVLERESTSRNNEPTWLVQCDCGETKVVLGASLRVGDTKPCGCLRREIAARRCTGGKPGTALRNLMQSYKSNAKAFNREFSLTEEQFKCLTSGLCFYCGATGSKTAKSVAGETYKHNGIDRKDPSLGYVESNCLPCCQICNFMKRDLSFQDFIDRCKLISERCSL
jgi:hypothetical protein